MVRYFGTNLAFLPFAGSANREKRYPMVWTEIKLKIPTARAEEAAGIANMVVPYGLYLEDYSDFCLLYTSDAADE